LIPTHLATGARPEVQIDYGGPAFPNILPHCRHWNDGAGPDEKWNDFQRRLGNDVLAAFLTLAIPKVEPRPARQVNTASRRALAQNRRHQQIGAEHELVPGR